MTYATRAMLVRLLFIPSLKTKLPRYNEKDREKGGNLL